MTYSDKFKAADELIECMRSILSKEDPETQSKFAGALSVSAVTVYELAIKDILIEYATIRHEDFGYFITKYLKRLNGRIKLSDLKSEIDNYGSSIKAKFETEINKVEESDSGIQSCYNNLILCRHSYVHRGQVTLSMPECIEDFEKGKKIIRALYNAMI